MPSYHDSTHHNYAPRMFGPRVARPRQGNAQLPKIIDLESFIEVHRRVDDKIKDYLEFPRPGWLRAPQWTALELPSSEEWFMPANNAESRISFAKIAVRHAEAHQQLQGGKVFFVTLTPADCAVPLSEAAQFDVRHLRTMVREALPGIDFIAMVEASLYINWGPNGPCRGFYVSWHVHLLAWNTSRFMLEIALRDFRRNHVSLLPHSSAAFIKAVRPGQMVSKLVYMLKAPQKEYWVNSEKGEFIDPETGEVLAGRRRQQKRNLRTGNRIRMLGVMDCRRLDRLMFGNCEGVSLSRAIKTEALECYRIWERRQPWFREKANG